MNETEDGYKLTNRDKAKSPKGKPGYCPGCDHSLTPDGRKCPVCKSRILPKRAKAGKPLVRE